VLVGVLISISVAALKKEPAYRMARRNGAEAELKIYVVNDEGGVVSNATIKVFMGMNFRPKGYWINGVTDANGHFLIQGKTCGDEIEVFVSKNGYYDSYEKLCFVKIGKEHDVNDGKWQPYGSKYNMIIETHGLQHYECVFDGTSNKVRSFEQEQKNDLFKKQLAIDNKINYYIELNCSKSNKEFIYKSIIDSNILTIFQVNQSDIDIDMADKFATSNIVKQCAKLWENGARITEISNIFKIHHDTVRRYLRKANKFGWCKY
jgi:hypothetical protein